MLKVERLESQFIIKQNLEQEANGPKQDRQNRLWLLMPEGGEL